MPDFIPDRQRQAFAMLDIPDADYTCGGLRGRDPIPLHQLPTDMHRLIALLDDAERELRVERHKLNRERAAHDTTRAKLIKTSKALSAERKRPAP